MDSRPALSLPDILPEQEREKIKQFDESEKKRYKAELQKQEKKFEKQLDSLRIRHESTLKELEQLQNEKRKMLMEHETLKLRELEAQYSDEIKEWKVMGVAERILWRCISKTSLCNALLSWRLARGALGSRYAHVRLDLTMYYLYISKSGPTASAEAETGGGATASTRGAGEILRRRYQDRQRRGVSRL